MTETEFRRLYGWAKIDPDGPVVAGEIGAWRITYHAGRYGVDAGGVIKIAWRETGKRRSLPIRRRRVMLPS